MKNDQYLVKFKSGNYELVLAYSYAEAEILAKAEQIKKGNDYTVICCDKLD